MHSPRIVSLVIFWFCLFLTGWNPVAIAAPPPAKHFGTLPRIFDGAISPNGKEVAFIINHHGQYVVKISKLGEKETQIRAVTLEEGVKPTYIHWANNQQVIVSLWQSEIFNRTPLTFGYLYSLNTAKMKGKVLIKPPRGLLRQYNNVVVDWLEDDPDHILMSFSPSSNNEKPDLRKVNVQTGKDRLVKRGQANTFRWFTDQRGEPRIAQGRRDTSKAEWVLKIRDADGKDWQSSHDFPGLPADTRIYGFTQDPNEIVIRVYKGRDTLGLYVYDLAQKKITREIFHHDIYDASGLIYAKDGKEIIGATYVANSVQRVLFGDNDTLLQAMRRKYEGFQIDFMDQSTDGKKVLFKMSAPYEPGFVMMISEGQAEPNLISSLYPDLKSDDLGDVFPVKYKARDGVKIPAFVTLPPTITTTAQIKNVPFIVMPHGGPYGRDAKRFDYFAQFFASRGYGILQMNFRGSAGYGKAFKEAGRKNWVLMQEDVEDGARWLLEKGYADPERMCIVGWSYGGYAALMGAAKHPDIYKCAVAMAALTDIADLKRDIKKYRFGRAMAKKFIGDGFQSRDDVKANSPVKIAEDMKVPLFLAHGTKDQRVHFDQYRRMKYALRKSTADVTYMEFKDEDHFLSSQKNRQAFFEGIDTFLKTHMGESEFAP